MLQLMLGVYFNGKSSSLLFVIATLISDTIISGFVIISIADVITDSWYLLECCRLFPIIVVVVIYLPFSVVLGYQM